jgi:SAM-dependent methyltransferase
MDKKLDIISLNKRAWNRVAEKYEEANYGTISPLFEFFCNKIPKNGYILDAGCGTGLPYTKMLIEKGFKVLGIDISSQMLEIARKNVPEAEFTELSISDLEYENQFIGVLSSYVMLLFDPPLFKDISRRIANSLEIGGIFYVSLNEPISNDVDVDKEAIVNIMGEEMYSRAYTKEEVVKILKPLGMKLLKFSREEQESEEFGVEKTVIYVFEKTET